MDQSITTHRRFRLLTIALRECTPALEWTTFGALPGFDWIGDAPNGNDGLRQTLMTRPDVIVIPECAAVVKLLPVLDHLRRQGYLPQVVMVIPELRLDDSPSYESVIRIRRDQLDSNLAERLRQRGADSELMVNRTGV